MLVVLFSGFFCFAESFELECFDGAVVAVVSVV